MAPAGRPWPSRRRAWGGGCSLTRAYELPAEAGRGRGARPGSGRLASYISEWIEVPVNLASLDGHWNGDRSGYAGWRWAAFSGRLDCDRSDLPSMCALSREGSGVPGALSAGLYAPFAGLDPPITPVGLDGTAIDMRTSRVCANCKVAGTESYFERGRLYDRTEGPGRPRRRRRLSDPRRGCTICPAPMCPEVSDLSCLPGNDSVTMRYEALSTNGDHRPLGASEVPSSTAAPPKSISPAFVRPTTGCAVGGALTSSSQPMPGRLDLSGKRFHGRRALRHLRSSCPPATPMAALSAARQLRYVVCCN